MLMEKSVETRASNSLSIFYNFFALHTELRRNFFTRQRSALPFCFLWISAQEATRKNCIFLSQNFFRNPHMEKWSSLTHPQYWHYWLFINPRLLAPIIYLHARVVWQRVVNYPKVVLICQSYTCLYHLIKLDFKIPTDAATWDQMWISIVLSKSM